jgi:hypothetical protein
MTVSINECINEFYKLKESYEEVYKETYIKPILMITTISFKEKRLYYSKLPKHECINCKRNVGSIFSITYVPDELSRRFIVKCGDLKDPCPLDIHFMYSERMQLNYESSECMKIIKQLKLDIIKEKNNSLFFVNEQKTVANFEKLTNELKLETELCGSMIETNLLVTHNPEKQHLIKKNVDEFGKGYLLPFKEMMHEYMLSNNETVLHNATSFYVNEMKPKLKQIQDLKYQVNLVEETDEKMYVLVQNKNSIQSTENFVNADDKVISFIKGVQTTKKSLLVTTPNKTMKIKTVKTVKPSAPKTKKLKPTITLVEDVDTDVEEPINEA